MSLPPLQFLELGRFRVAYRAQLDREGPVHLLVHGLGSSHLVWLPVLRALQDRNFVAVDLPGYGESSKPRYRYTLAFYESRLRRVLDALGVRDAVWVAHSMGAQIAVHAELASPSRVRALALFAPAGFERFDARQAAVLRSLTTFGKVRASTPRQIEQALDLGFHRRPPEAQVLLDKRMGFRGPELDGYAHAFSRSVRAMLEAPVLYRLGELRGPVVVRLGAEDALVPSQLFSPRRPAELVVSIQQRLPHADVSLVPEAGHLLPFERPDAVIDALDGLPSHAACCNAQSRVAVHKTS